MSDTVGAYIDTFKSPLTEGKGSLDGMTVAVKDLLNLANGRATTAASRILGATAELDHSYRSPYTATVVQKLLDAGAEVTGKTDLDEFAMGSSNETSALAETKPAVNPWEDTRVPGGSSGGSAAAVASGQAVAALGTDTGGSVRQPAAFCGVVGIKPTYGRVSRYGAIALASSLDQVGVFGRTVKDAAAVLEVIAGQDPHDATTIDQPVPAYSQELKLEVKGLKIGLPKEYFIEGVEPEVEQAVRAVADELVAQGAEIVEVSLPHTKYAIGVYYIIQPAEGSSNLARYDGIRYGNSAEYQDVELKSLEDVYYQTRTRGFGEEVQRRIMLGTYVLSAGYYDAYYKKAMQVRTLLRQDFDDAFKQCDLMLTPTTPTTAFKRGEKTNDPLQMYLNDIFTVTANLTGTPGISVPCGFDSNNLPIGAQLLGPQWSEQLLLNVAAAHEQQHDWHTRQPGGNA